MTGVLVTLVTVSGWILLAALALGLAILTVCTVVWLREFHDSAHVEPWEPER